MILDVDQCVEEVGGLDVDLSNLHIAYSYLLGVYLGDGCLCGRSNDGNHSLRIACDPQYPKIMAEISRAIRVLFPKGNVLLFRHPSANCQYIEVCDPNLLKLFPQHETGRKTNVELR